MKILFVSHDSKLYGAPRSLLNLIEGIKKDHPQIEMHVLLPSEGLLADELRKNNIAITVASFPWSASKPVNASWPKRTFRWLKKMKQIVSTLPSFIKTVKKINPDIIHSNTSVVSHGYFAAKYLNKKHIWHIREFGWEDHGQLYDFGNRIQRFFYNTSNLVIVISNAIKEAKLNGLKVPVVQIYNGVCFDNELVWPARTITADQTIKFAIVGGVRKSKGQDEAIQGFGIYYKKHPNAQLLIVGDANPVEKARLTDIAVESGCKDGVIFTGFTQDVDSVYQQIDVLLSCSKSEGMGRSIVEAMARGLPVISKNAGGAVELVVNDFNGLIYDTVDELGLQMEAIVFNNKYNTYSKNSISWVRDNFTIENYVSKVVNTINTI